MQSHSHKANYINHIALVLDASSSMRRISDHVVRVADAQIRQLAETSKQMNQETRITVYTFDDNVACAFYDKDVLRLPSLKGHYRTEGCTALVDATMQAIGDLEKTATLYGDHAFLVYVLTDGQENHSVKFTGQDLANKAKSLPENWQLAAFVPDSLGVQSARYLGFPAGNIMQWEATAEGLKKVEQTMRAVNANYMQTRSTGVSRGYTGQGLFDLNTAALTKATVNRQLVKKRPSEYLTIPVGERQQIHQCVSKATGKEYKIGTAFYQLMKKETIQPDKKILVREKVSLNLYEGSEARTLLNLPDHDVKVAPKDNADYELFVQSKSVNRIVLPGTHVIVP